MKKKNIKRAQKINIYTQNQILGDRLFNLLQRIKINMIQINNTKNKKINNLNLNFLSPSSKKMLEIKLLPEVKTLMITH